MVWLKIEIDANEVIFIWLGINNRSCEITFPKSTISRDLALENLRQADKSLFPDKNLKIAISISWW